MKDQRAPLTFLTFNQIGVYDPLAQAKPIAPRPALEAQVVTPPAEIEPPEPAPQGGPLTVVLDPEAVRLLLEPAIPEIPDDLAEVEIPESGFYR